MQKIAVKNGAVLAVPATPLLWAFGQVCMYIAVVLYPGLYPKIFDVGFLTLNMNGQQYCTYGVCNFKTPSEPTLKVLGCRPQYSILL